MSLTTTPRVLLAFGPFLVALGVLSNADFASSQQGPSLQPNSAAVPNQPRKLPDDIEQVLWWLPEDTETVVVSRGKVPVPEFVRAKPPANPNVPYIKFEGYTYPTQEYEFQQLVARECIEPLVLNQVLYSGETRLKLINSIYGQQTATLFMKAVWWDANARRTCDIVVFRDGSPRRILESLAAFPHVPRDIGGVRVLEVDLNNGRFPPGPYVAPGLPRDNRQWLAAPHPNVYVAATSSEMMTIIIDRIKRRAATRALPTDLPEWRQLDPAAAAWGLRHYRPRIAEKDPLSMLKWDPNAKGLVVLGGSQPTPFVALRYVSDSQDAGNRLLRMQSDWLSRLGVRSTDISTLPPIERISPNCVESRMRINVPPSEVEGKPLQNLSVDSTRSYCMDLLYLPWLGFPCMEIASSTK